MIITKRLAAGACALLAALAAGIAPASAADGPSKNSPKVELVLDVSGSMRATDLDGRSRMSVAKEAFGEVIDAVPSGVRLGIRTLGANYPGDDRELGCRDSKQLYRVGPVDRTEAKAAVATLQPTGWTPIGYALRGADQDLGTDGGTRRIVLITDGEDSCGQPDPCDVARELAAKGTHLTIDTLGLAHDDKTREQLSCIAEATGGTYTSVQHKDELSGRIKQLVRRAEVPVETPKPVNGANECAKAPELGAGLWTDRATFSEHRWYKVQVKPGQELRTSVSVGADRAVDRDYGVLIRAVGPGGRELVRGSDAGSGRTDVMSSGLRYPVGKSGDDEKDKEARTVCLEVSHSFSAPASVKRDPGLPVELAVDLTDSPDSPSDIAAFGLGRGWVLLGVLVLTGLIAGLVWGWVSRWRVSVWRAN
ncbi:Inter-alpha-trypsin inhibitor heavy chain H5 [Streptomyces albireticuli]|uniref:Inter-alpha-trypsin inhibitor heavy chain H5 n=1 Tax=Streptomyces albireticuli TaxID=1940 RepID=A0A1Z2KWX1_9ACTN|nr:VWA domain-containing protein [Streptomyces albireticuli]ARZ66544.1 Inter-alpha-trypsin inhibitor heavy chain H5 [Streptomyces albireticuli]